MALSEQTQLRIKHTIYFIGGIALAVVLFWSESLREIITNLGSARYVGSLIAGLFYSTSFLAASSTVAFFELGKDGNIFLMAVIGGAGSLVYDYIIHRFVQDRFSNFISRLIHKDLLDLLDNRRVLSWFITVAGIIILGSPLPDELGASLLGLGRMRRSTFLALSFFLNSIGILIILAIGRSAS